MSPCLLLAFMYTSYAVIASKITAVAILTGQVQDHARDLW